MGKTNTTTVRRGDFKRGERYVRASSVWLSWSKNKYRGIAASGRGAPMKHKRVGNCPECTIGWKSPTPCFRPGVPATRSFSFRMTKKVRGVLELIQRGLVT